MTAKPDPKPDAAHADVVQLKKCPFCGTLDQVEHIEGAGSSKAREDRKHWYYCRKCNASGPAVDTKDQAGVEWNKRAG